MARGKTDISKMLAKHRAIVNAGPKARQAALREVAGPILAAVEAQAPRDTNRYVRAYMQAANQIGVGKAEPPVQEGKFAEEFLTRLETQVSYWQTRYNQYVNAGRTKERYFRKIEKRLTKAREQLQKWNPSAIIIFGRRSAKGGNTLTRAIGEVYGGEGRFVESGNRTFLQLVNKEPHARIVETRHFGMRSLLNRATKGTGVSRAKAAHLKVLKAEAKLGGK